MTLTIEEKQLKWNKLEKVGIKRGVINSMVWEAEDMYPTLEGFVSEKDEELELIALGIKEYLELESTSVFSENFYLEGTEVGRIMFYIDLNLVTKKEFKKAVKMYKKYSLKSWTEMRDYLWSSSLNSK